MDLTKFNGINIDTTAVVSQLSVFAKVLLYGFLAMGVIYLISYFVKYKYPLHLYIQTGTGKRYVRDRGKKDKKTMKFVALKNKDITFPYPETKYEYQQGRKSCLTAYIENQSATWLEISQNPHFIPANYDMQSKMINDLEGTWEMIQPQPNFWDKYGQQILWGGSIAVFLIVIILILQRMDKIIEMGRSVAIAQASQGKQVVNMLLPIPFMFMRKKDEP